MTRNDFRAVASSFTRRQILGSGAVLMGLSVHPSLAWSATGAQVPLWVARKNGRNIYILGESLPRSTNWHQPDAEALLRRCGQLWTETNQVYRKSADALVKSYGIASSPSKLTAGRNIAWIPRFEGMLRDPTPTLVVVGLYHLVGPDSLLAHLRGAGFAIGSDVNAATFPND